MKNYHYEKLQIHPKNNKSAGAITYWTQTQTPTLVGVHLSWNMHYKISQLQDDLSALCCVQAHFVEFHNVITGQEWLIPNMVNSKFHLIQSYF